MIKYIKSDYNKNAMKYECTKKLESLCDEIDLEWWDGAKYLDEDTFYETFLSEHQYFSEYDKVVEFIKQEFERWFLREYGYKSWDDVPSETIDMVGDLEYDYGLV